MAKLSKIVKAEKLKNHPTKAHSRCQLCGRSRGFMRIFGLCRLCFRKLAHKGELPGVYKDSK